MEKEYLNWYSEANVIETICKNSMFHKTGSVEFFNAVALHDSYIIDTVTSGYNSVYLVILLDPVWNQGINQPCTGMVQEWPVLFLHISAIKTMEYRFSSEENLQFGIAGVSVNNIDGDLIRTEIISHFSDTITIKHKDEMQYLCFDKDRNIIPVLKKNM